MAEIDELVIKIGANFDELKKGLKEAQTQTTKGTSKMAAGFGKMRGAVNKVGSALGPLAVAAAGVATAFLSVKTIMDSISGNTGLVRMAEKLGITTEAFSELAGVAKIFGVEQDRLGDTMKDLSDKISDAANNGAAYEESLQMLGLRSKDLLKLNMEDQFLSVVDALGKMTNSANQSFVSMDLMADAGFDIINMAKIGKKGIAEMRKEVTELGGSLNEVEAKKFKEISKNMAKFEIVFEGIAKKMAIGVSPALEFFIEQIIASGKNINSMDGAFGTFSRNAVGAIGFIKQTFDGLLLSFKGAEIALRFLSLQFAETQRSNVRQIQWFEQVNGASWKVIKESANVALESIKFGFTKLKSVEQNIIVSITKDFADMVINIGKSMKGLPLGLGDAAEGVIKGGQQLIKDANKMSDDSSKALDIAGTSLFRASGELSNASEEFVNAITGKNLKTPIADALVKDLSKSLKQAQGEFGDLLDPYGRDDGAGFENEIAKFEEFRANKKEKEDEAAEEDKERLIAKNAALAAEQSKHLSFIERLNRGAEKSLTKSEVKEIKLQAGRIGKGFGDRLKIASGFFSQMSVLMETGNRKQFEIGKAAAIAGALVDTYRGAAAAYTGMVQTVPGPVGIGLGIAAASASVIAGLAQVKAIKSQSMGGGGGGGGSAAGGAAPSAAAAAPAAAAGGGAEGGAAQETRQVSQFNIALSGGGATDEQIRGLIGQINDNTDDNVELKASSAA